MTKQERDELIEGLKKDIAAHEAEIAACKSIIDMYIKEPCDDEFKPGDVVEHEGNYYLVVYPNDQGGRTKTLDLKNLIDIWLRRDEVTKTDLRVTTIGPDECVVKDGHELTARSVNVILSVINGELKIAKIYGPHPNYYYTGTCPNCGNDND